MLYADTRLELLPLWLSARSIQDELGERGVDVRTVMAPLDKRFLVYLLGRGVPPPNNNTLRWCTQAIKIDPMAAELRFLAAQRWSGLTAEDVRRLARDWPSRVKRLDGGASWEKATAIAAGLGIHDKILLLTGVRQGESAIRDGRIAMSCGRDGAECGQGWYQETLPGALCDTLAPLLHWRVCHVWAWLRQWAPLAEFGDWSTEMLADAYGGDEAEESLARTGCVGCPLAERDTALDAVVAQLAWAYLAPLKRLRPLWRTLRAPAVRLRKRGLELRADGTPAANPQRMGPLTFEARLAALEEVIGIQREINVEAVRLGRPLVDLLNAEEEARVRELIAAGTWPDGWSGDEPLGDVMLDRIFADGTTQPLLPIFGGVE